MVQKVSKARTKKTKTREKQSTKSHASKAPLPENSVVGVAIMFSVWAFSVLLLDTKHILCHLTDFEALLPVAGNAGFLLTSMLAIGLFLKMASPKVAARNSKILLLAFIAIIALIPIKALLYVSGTTGVLSAELAGGFLLPLVMAPLLATILLGSNAGIGVGIWISLAASLMAGGEINTFITGIVVTMVTARTAMKARTRSKIIKTGIIVGLIEIGCVFAVTAISWQSTSHIFIVRQASACLISGLASATITLLILPLLETLFKITTDITLLEYSDLSHPLLQKLALEAPGTYHHSLIVANLAQAAADEIGANSLQARICSYFHDIGKLVKPEFFTENTQLHNNPHDQLQPSMSTLVIIAHVKEGVSLGMLHKLPDPIMNVIREHHGTGLLSYFHKKAQSQLELGLDGDDSTASNGQKVDERDFRYSGPRPASKVSGIICIADAVEAASRTMEKTTPGHIETLVNDMTNIRLKDGQLDDCSLSLAELTKVKKSFVFTLTNMLHGRVPYPKDENRDKQSTKPTQDKQTESKKADSATNGKSHQSG